MKRLVTTITLAAAVLAPLAGPTVAKADPPQWVIAGFQFAWYAGFEDAGHSGYLGTPAGPVSLAGVQPGGPIGNSATVDVEDASGMSITNFDRVDHTFTQCTADCEGMAPQSVDPTFDITVPASSNQVLTLRPSKVWELKTYTFFCKNHPWMRGTIRVK